MAGEMMTGGELARLRPRIADRIIDDLPDSDVHVIAQVLTPQAADPLHATGASDPAVAAVRGGVALPLVFVPIFLTALVLVAELMGHSRLETTRGYTRPGRADREHAIGSLPTDR